MVSFNPFADWLEQEPRPAYFSYRDRFGGPSGSRRQAGYFSNAFSDLYQEYLGRLGQQARGGAMPMGSFNDFLGGFNFDDWYRQEVPYGERNRGFGNFVPALQWKIPGINA